MRTRRPWANKMRGVGAAAPCVKPVVSGGPGGAPQSVPGLLFVRDYYL